MNLNDAGFDQGFNTQFQRVKYSPSYTCEFTSADHEACFKQTALSTIAARVTAMISVKAHTKVEYITEIMMVALPRCTRRRSFSNPDKDVLIRWSNHPTAIIKLLLPLHFYAVVIPVWFASSSSLEADRVFHGLER